MANSSIRYGEGVTREVGMVSLCICLKSEWQVDELTEYMAGLAQLAADLFILLIPKFAQIQANISAIGHSLSSCQVSITVPSPHER